MTFINKQKSITTSAHHRRLTSAEHENWTVRHCPLLSHCLQQSDQ